MDTYRDRMSPEDLADLAQAKQRLEYPSFTARLAEFLGSPIERGLESLPADWQASTGSAPPPTCNLP
jgi:hypothetical protein